MSKAIQGAAELGAALGMGALMFAEASTGVGLSAIPVEMKLMAAFAIGGITTEAGAIASAIGSKSGFGITTRTPASLRQIIRGVRRIGGTIVYLSTTGSTKRQYNMVIVLAGHPCLAIENLYLDGRQVFWDTSSAYNQTVGGYNFGGNSDGSNHTGPNGDQYNFGGLVFCAAFYGNQNSNPTVVSGTWVGPNNPAGFCSALQANDPTWAPATVPGAGTASASLTWNGLGGGEIDSITLDDPGENYANGAVTVTITDLGGTGSGASATANAVGGSIDPTSLTLTSAGANYSNPQIAFAPPSTQTNTPYLGGCTYVYLKLEYDAGTFPQFPEIRFTVHGKSDIWDPRASTRGFTTNPALHAADAIMDPTWGLGDASVNQDQLIAAANICDEMVSCAAGVEAQYSVNMFYDASAGPGDVLDRLMRTCAGRLARIGGQWFIFPAAFPGASFTFDENSLLDAIKWDAKRPLANLMNRVTGVYTAPNFPYNVAGNLYDSNGYYNGATQNNFPFAFQPTSFPMYAADILHGYSEDVYLVADTPNLGAWSSGAAYNGPNYASGLPGDTVIYDGVPWTANEAVPAGNAPGSVDGSGNPYWSAAGSYLPADIDLTDVLSISQAQRIAKITMMRNRQQGSGVLVMSAAALAMQPVDVLQFNFAALGWTNKLLEVCGQPGEQFKWKYAAPPSASAGSDQVPALYCEIPVSEIDPSVYEWDPAEELTPYDIPAISGGVNAFIVGAPTSLAALSDITTAVVQPDGTTVPQIELTWTAPADTYVTNGGSIEIQMTPHGTGAWVDVLIVAGQTTQAFIGSVTSGNYYDLRIRSVRPNGAQSAWVEIDNILCGPALSALDFSDVGGTAAPGQLPAATTGSLGAIKVGAGLAVSSGVLAIAAATTLTYASTLATNAALGNLFRVTLTGNVTLSAPTGMTDGQKVAWEFIQDGTGSRTVALPSVFKFGTDIASFTATTAASLADYLEAVYNATTGNWSVVGAKHGYTP